MDHRAVVELAENAAWLAATGEAGKARAARADAPGRHGDREGADRLGDGLDVDVAARERALQGAKILGERRGFLGVGGLHNVGADE